jgi:hypothetical protein
VERLWRFGKLVEKLQATQGPCETVEMRPDALELNLIVYLNLLKLDVWFNLKLGKLGIYF